jgi:hypothetical protein
MSETNGHRPEISQKTRDAFVLAINNSSGQLKRCLLDFLDFQEETLMADPTLSPIHARIKQVFGWTKRRIHNDVSTQRDQVLACFEVYESGGIIPPFGRSQEARDASVPWSGRKGSTS